MGADGGRGYLLNLLRSNALRVFTSWIKGFMRQPQDRGRGSCFAYTNWFATMRLRKVLKFFGILYL